MDLTNLNKDKKARRKSSIDLTTMVYGKLPPQAKDLEEAVLGAIMLDKSIFDSVSEILRPECFYVEAHATIFKAMQMLAQKSQPIDILTVTEQLKANDALELIGGPYYVTKLTSMVVSSANLEFHARIIMQKFIQRELIRISGETISDAYEDSCNAFDLMDEHEKQFTAITARHLQKTYSSLDRMIIERMKRIEYLRQLDDHITGIPSGFVDLDRITHGWQATDLIILAARPSVGKTALALNLARNAALHPSKHVPVGFFSMEMSNGQLTDRFLSAESGIAVERIQNGLLDDKSMQELYTKGIQPLASIPIFVDDTPALSLQDLRTKARSMKRKHNVGIIFLDYLQLMSGGDDERRGNREQEISKISRGLKALAKELAIPIVALSQLSREPEKRKGEARMPQLSDLRESGAIEQDADTVIFMYRPEYYEITANELGDSTRGETHLKIAKHRSGKLDSLKLRANLIIQKFFSWDGQQQELDLGSGTWKPVTLPGVNYDEFDFDK